MNGFSRFRFPSSSYSAIAVLVAVLALAGCNSDSGYNVAATSTGGEDGPVERESPFVTRRIEITRPDNSWVGNGISYGPFRDGQAPGQSQPSKEEIREDLQLLVNQGWQMIRIYGSDPFAKTICEVLREDQLQMTVMVGAWIGPVIDDQSIEENKQQVEQAVALANDYGDVVNSICIGNETQVEWSDHRVDQETLIEYIREARWQTVLPVGVADDFTFWSTEESKALANEIDMVVAHVYAMWHSQQLDDAVAFTKDKYEIVRDLHPRKDVLLGECGWATDKLDSGDQAERLAGAAGEDEQAQFFQQLREWVQTDRVPYFYFSAFDENWKGSDDPKDAEKHWGIHNADRTPKAAAATLSGTAAVESETAAVE